MMICDASAMSRPLAAQAEALYNYKIELHRTIVSLNFGALQ